MPKPQQFIFENEAMTIRQIRERVPVLSEACIRTHLAAGRATRDDMLCYDPTAIRVRNGRKAARRYPRLR